jgi:hypothetical protein
VIKSSPKTRAKRVKMKHLSSLVRQIVMLRDGEVCIRADCRRAAKDGYKIDAHHILAKGSHRRLEFEPYNVIPLCFVHHRQWHDAEGREWLEKQFPGKWDALQIMARTAPKLDYELLRIVLEKEVEGLRGERRSQ